jgi:two-component system phosphate regulon sensor histidine kinase PhoR
LRALAIAPGPQEEAQPRRGLSLADRSAGIDGRLGSVMATPLWWRTLLLGAPSGLLLAWLALGGVASPRAATAALLATLAAALLVLRPLLAGLGAIREGAEALAEERAPPTIPTAAPVEEAWSAVARLARARRDRLAHAEGELADARAVLGAVPDALLVLDRRRRVRFANPAAAAALGVDAAGRDLSEAIRNPAVLEAVAGVLARRGGRDVEIAGPIDDRRLETKVLPLMREDLAGSAALLLLRDVTLARRTEEMRADFVANVSHELRTPVAALLGFVETLRGPARDDPEARERFLAIMHDQATRMSRLVDDLLSLSRIELNEHLPPTGRVDVGDALRRVADTLQLKAAARGMRIEIAAGDKAPPVVGDPEEIAQVLQNLVDNALKYGRPDTAVEIMVGRVVRVLPSRGRRAAVPQPAVAIRVRDQGPGIAREHLPRLTQRFYRVDTARSRAAGGTGLGLAIVKHIVNRHRGALEIESELGRGSTFTVFFPVAAAE